ncbi:DUF4255 domain-containing protein [Myxococcus sp. CA051A]|uniref:DUF4255 domain-containing protein n=1 Tax=unclassified Myxococcus TaxID=2648731 RepID=UPI00157B909F|nr:MULTISPECIES: DUF4255 domain-containing protein [unclassified Myxococcus]NTX17206.1 DUF4255 domain-containing protein [Myxococcus sp. CA056]NTX39334.1 DUF4255 domain-containing protein [Myxococcus sp. CA033]NTX49734.1 DUF4255 domain-containing protein [Myxococcus sp. CA039A]NTX65505.1 DUF4255 domain-containing protein [Myxococcus sp. CA051A]
MGKLGGTLELVRRRLDEFIRNAEAAPRQEPWVVLSNLTDSEGRPAAPARDAVVMFLANIRHETIVSTYNRNVPVSPDAYGLIAPPLFIDLFVLLYANFEDQAYPVGLEAISHVISFFQQTPWFTQQSLPGLDPDIDKLTFEFVDLDLLGLNHLMGLAGVKYLPSVFYKVRMIPYRGEAMQGQVSAAKGVEAPGRPQGMQP